MRGNLKKCFHSFMVFCYVQLICFQSWAYNPFLEDPDSTLCVKFHTQKRGRWGFAEEGLKITLKHKVCPAMPQGSSFKTFIPYNFSCAEELPPQFREIKAPLSSENPVDFQSIGVQWSPEGLEGLEVAVLWDGSLLLKGTASGEGPAHVKVRTPGGVFFQDFSAHTFCVEAQEVSFSHNVRLKHLKSFFSTPNHKVQILPGGSLETSLVVMEKGTFINEGTLKGAAHPLKMRVQRLMNGPRGIFQAQEATFCPLHGTASTVVNEGLFQVKKMKGRVSHLENAGPIENSGFEDFALETLHNLPTGIVEGSGRLRLIKGINQGVMHPVSLQPLSVEIQEDFTNQGTLWVHELRGFGRLTNDLALQFVGTKETPARLGMATFINGGKTSFPCKSTVRADFLEVTSVVERWLNTAGVIEVQHLKFAPSLGESTLKNQALLKTGTLEILAKRFTNEGTLGADTLFLRGASFMNTSEAHMTVGKKGLLQGKVLNNEGTLRVLGSLEGSLETFVSWGTFLSDGALDLPKTTLVNQGTVHTKGPFKVSSVENQKTLLAEQGLSAVKWHNSGTAEIHKSLEFVDGFDNTGTLTLLDAQWVSALLKIENSGALFLLNTTFAPGFGTLVNHKTLSFEGRIKGLKHLINHNFVQFIGGDVSLGTFETQGEVSLLGERWRLTQKDPVLVRDVLERSGPEPKEEGIERKEPLTHHLESEHFLNTGQISVEGSLEVFHGALKGKVNGAKDFSIHRPQSTLTPEDLKGLETTSVLTIHAKNFDLKGDFHNEALDLCLYLSGYFKGAGDLKLKGLQVFALGDFMGGPSNEALAKIVTTQGPLTLEANAVDARFAKLYGAGPTRVKALAGDLRTGHVKYTPATFPYALCIAIPYASHYQRHDRNDSYMASGHSLELDAAKGSIILDYASLLSTGLITLNVSPTGGKIEGVTPSLQGDSLIFNGHTFVCHAPAQKYLNGPSGNRNYPEVRCYLECGIPGLIQAQKDITFNTSTVQLVGGCHLLAGECIYANNRLVAGGTQPYTNAFVTTPRHETRNSRNKGYGWDPLTYFKTHAPLIQAGQQIHLDMGTIQLTGTQNAPIITLQAQTASFINPSRTRDHHASVSLSIDLADYYREMMHQSGGFIKQLEDQTITTDAPLGGLVPLSSQVLLFNTHEQQTPLPRFLIAPTPLEFILQHALSHHVGQLNLDGLSGRDLMQDMYRNAQAFQETQGMITDPLMDVEKFQKAMIAYKAKEIAGQLAYAAQLLVPARCINPLRSIGDMSGQEISIETTGDQFHSGNQVVAQKVLDVAAGGQIKRETPKYVERLVHIGKTIEREVAGPQQIMGSLEGTARITSQGHYRETGVQSFAGTDLERGSLEAETTLEPLVLQTTVTETSKKRSGFSTKTTTHVQTSHMHVPSQGIAGRDSLLKAGPQASLTGVASKESAHQDLTLEFGQTVFNAMMTAWETTTETTTRGMLSDTLLSTLAQSPEVTRACLQAGRNIFFNGQQASINGTDVQALKVFNHTRQGLNFGPTLKTYGAQASSHTFGVFGRASHEQTVGQEVQAPTRLTIGNLITQDSPTTATNVQWFNKPLIEGTYKETFYHLKSWQTSKSSVSGLYDPTINALVSLAVALAVEYVTCGAGKALLSSYGLSQEAIKQSIMAQMVAAGYEAGLSTLTTQAVMTFATSDGDPLKVAQSLLSWETLKTVGVSAVTAGILKGLHVKLDIPEVASTLGQKIQSQSLKAGVSVAGSLALGNSPQDALRQAGIGFAASLIAHQIGQSYKGETPSLNYVTHKMAHGVLGAAVGSFLCKDKVQGALSGALGGVVSEMVSEALVDNADQVFQKTLEQSCAQSDKMTQEEFLESYNASLEVKYAADLGKISAGLVSLLAQQDVSVAIHTATNAVENNLIPAMVGLGLLAYEAYDIYHTYDQEGAQAAAEKLGFTVCSAVVGGVVVKNAFKLGGLAVATAEEALVAYKQANPLFASFYDKAAAVLAHQGSFLKPVVQKYKTLDAYLTEKTTQTLGKAKNWVARTEGEKSLSSVRSVAHTEITPGKSLEALDLASAQGKNKNLPSRVRKVNASLPKNHELAGQVYPLEKLPLELRQKYPHSVPFTGSGFPDFARYAKKKVKIKMTGDSKDFAKADKAAGFLKRPQGYTWHHHHDGETMLLVPTNLHEAVRHTGGSAICKHNFKKSNK